MDCIIKISTTKLTDIMMMRKFILFFFLWFQFGTLCAQVTVKTNLLGWGTASINGGIETKVSAKSTISLFGSINPFEFGNHKQWKHWLLQPEYRYWFCEPFYKGFIGVHTLGGEFNAARIELPFDIFPELADYRFQGWMAGGGISFGYQWLLNRNWNLEASVGVGYLYVKYDKYPCASCGTRLDTGHQNNVGPTKAAVSLVYIF